MQIHELVPLLLMLSHGVQHDANTRAISRVIDKVFENDKVEEMNKNVKFYLYRPNKKKVDITNVQAKHLTNDAPFKFLVHGWTESPAKAYIKELTSAYFERGNYNVVHVDWSKPASILVYKRAVKKSVAVGIALGRFILRICKLSSVTLKDIHIVSHSLGAHVAGVAGGEIFKRKDEKVYRITGLDPAGPAYEGLLSKKSRKLNEDDAEMVDIVHTDGGKFGCKKPMGTVDFFPNGGVALQPECPFFKFKDKISRLEKLPEIAFCSHKKSHAYYIQSINSKRYKALKCNSWRDFKKKTCKGERTVVFGEDTPFDTRGKYYFRIE